MVTLEEEEDEEEAIHQEHFNKMQVGDRVYSQRLQNMKNTVMTSCNPMFLCQKLMNFC